MDDLNEKLTQILNDPGSIQQIMQIANTLSGPPAEEGSGEASDSAAPPEMLSNISKALHQEEKKDKRRDALFQALRPYLRPNRLERLERAMQIAQLSHLAGVMFRTSIEKNNPHEEVNRHL